MNAHQTLLEKIASLQSQQFKIREQGDVLLDCWIAQSKPSGTARTDNSHWQLRSRKPQFGGRKSKYLKPSEVGQFEEAIARGKELKRLEREIGALRQKVERVEQLYG
ncbi:hypothetical protein H6G00_21955 [Leptolyngbya sp. FACHB-541]|uniref:hypothetical protein n=1 Tax=Leptolyngbya sp. FACHB-541 TaxID=2692810 RepID=UPI0016859C2A|nr:hypothetical protein [Leptolyngbya sp. FACHB-541]MBD1999243.1 hypothetical protein [Leptolyngbya sp. FACHB-541]